MKLNRTAYERVIAEDVEVLNGALPQHSLERQHIEEVLKHSVVCYYGPSDGGAAEVAFDSVEAEVRRLREGIQALRDTYWNSMATADQARSDYILTRFVHQLEKVLAGHA